MSRTRTGVKYGLAATTTILYGASIYNATAKPVTPEQLEKVPAWMKKAVTRSQEAERQRVAIVAGVMISVTWMIALL